MTYMHQLRHTVGRLHATLQKASVINVLASHWFRLVDLAAKPWNMKRLEASQKRGDPVVNPKSRIYVSLTTYGDRVNTVHTTIESIASGYLKPGRLVLWLDDERIISNLPQPLVDLQRRGLEIAFCYNYGPHKKSYPAIQSGIPEDWCMVTADDDLIYPRWWLQRIAATAAKHPKDIASIFALKYAIDSEVSPDGTPQLAAMKQWLWAQGKRPSTAHFSVGVSGVAYPARLRAALKRRGTQFMQSTPRADDVWFNFVAAEEGIPTILVTGIRRVFPTLPGTQQTALSHTNVERNENDTQVTATYTQTAINNISTALNLEGGSSTYRRDTYDYSHDIER